MTRLLTLSRATSFLLLILAAAPSVALGQKPEGVSPSPVSEKLEIVAGRKLYNKVNLRADIKEAQALMYSTNYFGVQVLYPIGSEFEIVGIDKKRITLKSSQRTLIIEYVAKHSLVSFEEYLGQIFSAQKTSIPSGFSALDLEAIKLGQLKVGMSRRAVLHAVGYPPANLNPDLTSSILVFTKTRWLKHNVTFDAQDRVLSIQ
ncbi:MAG: hypothetical protein HY901_05295 [Deltaproteobacteria bacterium]|nr:hypothetical protein [Deltaproteobacteria bacterium]